MPRPYRSAGERARSFTSWGLARVHGESMRPTLREGDLLLVRFGAHVQVGALVVVRLPPEGTTAVKRVALRDPDGWWVERDGTVGVDSWTVGAVPDADVLAVVAARLWPAPRRLASPRPG